MIKFHLELTEKERDLLLYALGAIYQIPESSRLAQRVTALPATPAKPSPPVGIPAAVEAPRVPAPVSPPEPPAPAREKESVGELSITPERIERSTDGKAIAVHYQVRSSRGVRTTVARCWDPAQFEEMAACVGRPTTFLTKTRNGYLNIVGVKR